jgi:hypothetical protein
MRDNMDNNEIRRQILEILYEYEKTHPKTYLDYDKILNKINNVKLEELIFHVNYLEDKGYLEQRRLNGEGFIARINSQGMDIVENTAEFNAEFPSINFTNINNSKGVVVGSNNVKIDFNENLNIKESFSEIYNKIDPMATNSKKIEEQVQLIENELDTKKMDKSVIQSSMKWLSVNASWTIPLLTQIMLAVMI